MVIVDSDVWSEAFRKQGKPGKYVKELRRLVEEDEVVMIGPIRQEVLSGIKSEEMYIQLRDRLRAFPSRRLDDKIHELAARFFNTCRVNGIQGSHTDFLICACSVEWNVWILSKDKDYSLYSKCVPIKIVKI